MYGVVVMAALAVGGEAPDFGCKTGYPTGCYGCYGYGCYSAYSHGYGGHACWGACYGACYGSWSCSGCWGSACYGNWSCSGCYGCWGTSNYYPMYGAPVMPPADPKMSSATTPGKVSSEPPQARLVIDVPADAKLYIDDQLMKTQSEKRVFRTPVLEAGATYYYILRVEVTRDGKELRETRRITLKAGDEIREAFTETTIAAAARTPDVVSRK